MSLVAVAALAASLLLAKKPPSRDIEPEPSDHVPADFSLDALRQAGF